MSLWTPVVDILFLCFKCPLAQRCTCEKGERGPSGPAVSIYTQAIVESSINSLQRSQDIQRRLTCPRKACKPAYDL